MADEWFCRSNDQQHGPYTAGQLKQFAGSGRLTEADLVWKEGMPHWVPAARVRGLFPAKSGAAPVPSPSQALEAHDAPGPQRRPAAQADTMNAAAVPSGERTMPTSHASGAQLPKGFAVTGLVLGICGAVISIIPCLWMIGIIPDIVGVVFSVLALRGVKAGTAGGGNLARWGLGCGVVGIILWCIMMANVGRAVNELDRSLDNVRRDLDRSIHQMPRRW